MDIEVTKIVLLVLALLASAIFSASEAAYLSVQRGKLAALMNTDPKKARRVDRLASHPEKLLSTVLTGNNLANTAAAALGTGIFLSFMSPDNAVIFSTIAITVLLLIFAEAIPKTIATRYSVGFAYIMAVPLRIVEAVLLPPVWLLERLVRGITAVLGLPNVTVVSQDEIRALIDLGEQEGAVAQPQAEMLGQVFRMGEQRLRDLMTHRTEVVAVEEGTKFAQFLNIYEEHRHSRYPVYSGNIDSITGVLDLKDVVSAVATNNLQSGDDVTLLKKPAFFLPEDRDLGDLLSRMNSMGQEMVILADEYGGVTGLVTFDQIVGEIVGDGEGLSAGHEEELEAIDVNTYRVNGDTHIDDVNARINMGLPEGHYETIAGFVLARTGVIPQVGQKIHYNDFIVEVTEMRGIRVEELKVTKVAHPPSDVNQ